MSESLGRRESLRRAGVTYAAAREALDAKIRAAHDEGWTLRAIAAVVGCSKSHIHNVVRERRGE